MNTVIECRNEPKHNKVREQIDKLAMDDFSMIEPHVKHTSAAQNIENTTSMEFLAEESESCQRLCKRNGFFIFIPSSHLLNPIKLNSDELLNRAWLAIGSLSI